MRGFGGKKINFFYLQYSLQNRKGEMSSPRRADPHSPPQHPRELLDESGGGGAAGRRFRSRSRSSRTTRRRRTETDSRDGTRREPALARVSGPGMEPPNPGLDMSLQPPSRGRARQLAANRSSPDILSAIDGPSSSSGPANGDGSDNPIRSVSSGSMLNASGTHGHLTPAAAGGLHGSGSSGETGGASLSSIVSSMSIPDVYEVKPFTASTSEGASAYGFGNG